MLYPIYSLYLALHCKWSKTSQNNNIFSPVFAASSKKQQCGLRRQRLKGLIYRIACFKTHFLQGGVKTEVSHTVEKPQYVFIWVIYYTQQVRLICSYISSRYLINSTYICVCVTLAQTKVYWWGPDGVEGALPLQPAVNKLTLEPPTVRAKCDAICGCEAARGDELWPLNLPRHRRSPFTAATYRADRGHAERNAAHPSAKEKWDERGEGAKVCGERRVQSAAEPGASKTTSCAQTPKLLGANVSQSVKDAACLLAVSAENVIRGVFAKQEL